MSNLTITPEQWLKEKFQSDYCEDCHGDVEDHIAVPFEGNWFALCKDDAVCHVEDCEHSLGFPCAACDAPMLSVDINGLCSDCATSNFIDRGI